MNDDDTITLADYQAAVELATKEGRSLAASHAALEAELAAERAARMAAEADNAALRETFRKYTYGPYPFSKAQAVISDLHPGAALLTALRWYANIGNYDTRGAPGTTDPQEGEWRADMGERARAALKGRAE